jgi:hypothetical protein
LTWQYARIPSRCARSNVASASKAGNRCQRSARSHEEQPALAPYQAAELAALPEELGPARLVHGGVGVLQDMERVVDDPSPGEMHLEAQPKRLPHVHADGLHGPTASRGQGLREEPIQRLARALFPQPQGLPCVEVAHHRQELRLLSEEDLIHAELAERFPGPARRPTPPRVVVEETDRLRRQAPLGGHASHRGADAGLGDRRFDASRVVGLPGQERPRSRWRPHRRQATVWISTTSHTCQGPHGRSRTRRSVGEPAVAWVLMPHGCSRSPCSK